MTLMLKKNLYILNVKIIKIKATNFGLKEDYCRVSSFAKEMMD